VYVLSTVLPPHVLSNVISTPEKSETSATRRNNILYTRTIILKYTHIHSRARAAYYYVRETNVRFLLLYIILPAPTCDTCGRSDHCGGIVNYYYYYYYYYYYTTTTTTTATKSRHNRFTTVASVTRVCMRVCVCMCMRVSRTFPT